MYLLGFHNKKEKNSRKAALAMLLLPLVLVLSASVFAGPPFRYWGTTAGLLQGERIARVTTLYNDTLKADTDTTSWLAFGTYLEDFPHEREYAPTRFTAFILADTTGILHAAVPSVTLRAQLALFDTTSAVYEQLDGSLELVPDAGPITTAVGQSIPVPVYGGGWIRFIVSSADTARVRLDLWRAR